MGSKSELVVRHWYMLLDINTSMSYSGIAALMQCQCIYISF